MKNKASLLLNKAVHWFWSVFDAITAPYRLLIAGLEEVLKIVNKYVWHWIIFVLVVIFLAGFSFFLAVLSYAGASFYIVPHMHCELPLIMEPPHNTTIRISRIPVDCSLSRNSRYSWDFHGLFPETPGNMNGQEKYLAFTLYDKGGKDVYSIRRSFMLKYKSYLRLLFEQVLWAVPMSLGFMDEEQPRSVILGTEILNENMWHAAKVELDSLVSIYDAKLTARASLHGIAYLWYYWRISTMIVVISMFWVIFFSCGMSCFGAVILCFRKRLFQQQQQEYEGEVLGDRMVHAEVVKERDNDDDDDDATEDVVKSIGGDKSIAAVQKAKAKQRKN